MSRHKHKARGKVTQKLTRDGLVERNAVTGEEERLSKRSADFDIRGNLSGDRALSQAGTRTDASQSAKQRNRAAYKHARQRVQDTLTIDADTAGIKQDTPPQFTVTEDTKPETPIVADVTAAFETPDTPRTDEHIPLKQEHGIPQQPPNVSLKPTPGKSQQYYQRLIETQSADLPIEQPSNTPSKLKTEQYNQRLTKRQPADIPMEQPANTPSKLKMEREPKLQTDGDSALKFLRDDIPLPQGHSKRPKPKYGNIKQPAAESAQPQTPLPMPTVPTVPVDAAKSVEITTTPKVDIPQSPLRFDKPETLHLTSDAANTSIPPPKPKQRQTIPQSKPIQPTADSPRSAAESIPSKPSEHHTTVADAVPADSAVTPETARSPLVAPESALKPAKESKLRFMPDDTPPEAVKPGRKLEKAQKQADKSVRKLETAKSQLPAKKKLRTKFEINAESTGASGADKPKRKLYFEKEVKPQAEHLKGTRPLRPVKAAGNSALAFGHRKMYQVEQENVATEASHKAEMTAEGGVRVALRRHKTAPYRKVEKLQREAAKKSINLTYQKTLAENPKLKSNMLSRAFQKRKIKKDYAKAAREAQKTAQKAAKEVKKAGSAASNAIKAVAGVIKRHPAASAVVILILLLLFCLMSLIGAFGGMGSGGLGGILSASYLAEDADIDNAELAYTEWEIGLQEQIANAESSHSGYDEYRYNIGDISHNPYELMAYLTAKYQNFTYAAIQADLQSLFAEQYALAFTPSVETRYADPTDADGDGDYEPYNWNILTVTLTARNFSDVIASHMSGDELAHYAVLTQTKGARQYLANPFGDLNWLPYVTSNYGYRIHPISGEKDLHRGVDIGLPLGTEIHAGQDGTVTFAGWSDSYGNYVVIEDGKGLVSKYAHCDSLLVTTGQTVKTGDIIGTVGSTGNSTGPHLHLEVLKNGQYLNGLFFADTGSYSLTPNYGYAGAAMGDGSYAALIAEAEKYLGYAYVWGGSSPATSFDCSGYVSWVLTQSGAKNTGRLTAQGLYNICNPVSPTDARPGDLIFFTGTYSATTPVTHVGIYVGGTPKRMIHCGDPISYVSIETTYWQNHFYSFGRVPE